MMGNGSSKETEQTSDDISLQNLRKRNLNELEDPQPLQKLV